MKYRNFERRPTYPVERSGFRPSSGSTACGIRVGDINRWGVWLGRHVCKKITQAPDFELNENRNLMWTERGKARLILIFSTNTNRESVAYRSFSLWEFQARGVRKVTTGITGLWQPSVHSDVAF